MNKNNITEALEVLQKRELFLEKINRGQYKESNIIAQLLLIFIFTFFYGVIMGSYNGFAQALSTGVKLSALIVLTLMICFPSFYIVQLVLGSKIGVVQLLNILISGFIMVAVIMTAFTPIILFFQLSGDNYNFLQLLHVFVFAFSGIFGMKVVLDALTGTYEANGKYPKIGLMVFKIWIIIFAFVGTQLSWNMRPFIGNKGMEFQLFRTETSGNFYSTVFSSLGQLMGVNNSGPNKELEKDQAPTNDEQKPESVFGQESSPVDSTVIN
ncbi:MAG: hypothetical protein OEX02_03125 [Cyclobacteriaceae bacterium]|nr:hypothetical protein [Cyclobacteriaceae bacterium]